MTNQKKKTIQIISSYFHPVMAGSENFVLKAYSYLVRDGWDVLVTTTKNTPDKKNVLSNKDEINGINIQRHNQFSFIFLPFSLGIKYRSSGVLCLNDFTTLPDLFICFYTILLKVLGLKKYKLVLLSMGLFNYDSKIYPSISFKVKQFIDHSIGVWLINNSVDLIQSVSQEDKNGLTTAGVKESLIEVIGCGIEEQAFVENINELVTLDIKNQIVNTKYILQVSRVNRIKNFDTTIRALSLLPQDINFIIAGPIHDQQYLEELNKLISELGLNNRVFFLGQVSTADKYYLMKHSKAFVLMSKYEGFGIVVLEAMSQGSVCIVSNNGALPELIKDGQNGYCEFYDNYKAVAARINYILDNPEIAETIGKNNINFSSDKSWKNVSEKVGLLYSKLEGI